MPVFRLALAPLLLLLALGSGPAYAKQDAPRPSGGIYDMLDVANILTPDKNVPSAPALALLGLDSNALATVANPNDFALSGLTHTDANGRLQFGGAASSRPYWWGDRLVTLNEYREMDWLRRVAARASVSLAATETTLGDDEVFRAGIGLHLQLLDAQDPRLNSGYLGCLQDIVTGAPLAVQANQDADAAFGADHPDIAFEDYEHHPAYDAYFEKAVAELTVSEVQMASSCDAVWEQSSEENASLVVGLGMTFLSERGQFNDIDQDAASLWLAYRHGLRNPLATQREIAEDRENFGSLGLALRYDDGATVTGPGNDMQSANEASASLAFRRERGHSVFEIGYTWADRDYALDSLEDTDYTRFGASYAYQLTREGLAGGLFSNAWIELSYSHASDLDLEDEDRFMVQFKCGDANCFGN